MTLPEARAVAFRRANGRCQAGIPDVCTEAAAVAHHIVPRSRAPRWPGLHDPDNLAALCDPYHRWVHAHAEKATALDLLRPAPPPTKSVPAPWASS